MAIVYNKLFALIKERGKSEYYLRQNKISSSVLSKLKSGTGDQMHALQTNYVGYLNVNPVTLWNMSHQKKNRAVKPGSLEMAYSFF